MNKRQLYIRAAELLDTHEENFCCLAIARVASDEQEEDFTCATLKDFYYEDAPDRAIYAWMSHLGEDLEEGRERRVLALLFMAAIES